MRATTITPKAAITIEKLFNTKVALRSRYLKHEGKEYEAKAQECLTAVWAYDDILSAAGIKYRMHNNGTITIDEASIKG